jgi:hypothetical protein
MKKRAINVIFKFLTLLLLCAGFTLAIMESQYLGMQPIGCLGLRTSKAPFVTFDHK